MYICSKLFSIHEFWSFLLSFISLIHHQLQPIHYYSSTLIVVAHGTYMHMYIYVLFPTPPPPSLMVIIAKYNYRVHDKHILILLICEAPSNNLNKMFVASCHWSLSPWLLFFLYFCSFFILFLSSFFLLIFLFILY